MKDILIIAGSNNKNLELAQKFKEIIDLNKVSNEIIDVVALNLPLYSSISEISHFPKEVRLELLTKFQAAKGFLFCTPEFNGGLPPALLNLLAWLSRGDYKDWRKAFNGKAGALATFSDGGGIQALMMLRIQLSYMGVNVVGRQLRATLNLPIKETDLKAVSSLLLRASGFTPSA